MSAHEEEKAAWDKLIAEGKAKRFDSTEKALSEGYSIMCHDGLWMKGGTQIPRAAYARLFEALTRSDE